VTTRLGIEQITPAQKPQATRTTTEGVAITDIEPDQSISCGTTLVFRYSTLTVVPNGLDTDTPLAVVPGQAATEAQRRYLRQRIAIDIASTHVIAEKLDPQAASSEARDG
jgi:hypothetical protein